MSAMPAGRGSDEAPARVAPAVVFALVLTALLAAAVPHLLAHGLADVPLPGAAHRLLIRLAAVIR